MLIEVPSVGKRPSLDGDLPELGVLPSGGEPGVFEETARPATNVWAVFATGLPR
jgi:hypothetical protein